MDHKVINGKINSVFATGSLEKWRCPLKGWILWLHNPEGQSKDRLNNAISEDIAINQLSPDHMIAWERKSHLSTARVPGLECVCVTTCLPLLHLHSFRYFVEHSLLDWPRTMQGQRSQVVPLIGQCANIKNSYVIISKLIVFASNTQKNIFLVSGGSILLHHVCSILLYYHI